MGSVIVPRDALSFLQANNITVFDKFFVGASGDIQINISPVQKRTRTLDKRNRKEIIYVSCRIQDQNGRENVVKSELFVPQSLRRLYDKGWLKDKRLANDFDGILASIGYFVPKDLYLITPANFEASYILKYFFSVYIQEPELDLRFGDVLCIGDIENQSIRHMMVYIGDGIVLSKNGHIHSLSWAVQDEQEVLRMYYMSLGENMAYMYLRPQWNTL